MKKLSYATTFSALALLFTSTFINAATVQFSWDDPAKFQDMKQTTGTDARFRSRVMSELEAQFRREAEKLPADQTLHVTVHDVDLAGYVEYFHPAYPFGLRVIRNVDFPIIDLSYQLTDPGNELIKSGREEIKDLNFRNTTLTSMNRDPLGYENQLIKKWYDSEFNSDI